MLLFNIVSQLDNIIQLGKLLSYDCNQKKAHPQIEQSGGTIKGNKGNDIGLPHGSHIPPKKVDIVKPDNLNY